MTSLLDLELLDEEEIERRLNEDPALAAELQAELGQLRIRYCPVEPTVKQEWFLMRDEQEVFFGGAAGPGKSWGLLQAGLQYVDVPGYDALLLRPTLSEFEKPGGLIDISHDWLDTTDAWWNGTKRQWAFPDKATLTFGYLSAPRDIRQYKGTAFSFVGFDELTGFPENLYRAMFRVLRQPKDKLEGVPIRMRSASNPGDIGHKWVKERFVNPVTRHKGVVYVSATIHDNPHLDYDKYLLTLAELSPIERERLIKGDWDVTEEGDKFTRDDFKVIAEPLPNVTRAVRYWDLAATVPSQTNPNPDFTVGLRLDETKDGLFCIRHIVRGRWADHDVENTVRRIAQEDGRAVSVYIEQEPGASGKLVVQSFIRTVLKGYAGHPGLTRGGSKEVRARPVAAAAKNGLVYIVEGPNLLEFMDEVVLFPPMEGSGVHDDCVDALSGAYTALTGKRRGSTTHVPQGRLPQPGGGVAGGVPGGGRVGTSATQRIQTSVLGRTRA